MYMHARQRHYTWGLNYLVKKLHKCRIKEKYKKAGKVNMCQGLREWMEDERAGGEERFASLTESLIKCGRMEDLLRAAKDKQYREILFRELKL